MRLEAELSSVIKKKKKELVLVTNFSWSQGRGEQLYWLPLQAWTGKASFIHLLSRFGLKIYQNHHF